jgi:hypothetical protein
MRNKAHICTTKIKNIFKDLSYSRKMLAKQLTLFCWSCVGITLLIQVTQAEPISEDWKLPDHMYKNPMKNNQRRLLEFGTGT